MKFILTLYLCSSVFSKCIIVPGYPQTKQDYYTCVKSGLDDAKTYLFAKDGLTPDEISTSRFYMSYTCFEESKKLNASLLETMPHNRLGS